MLSDAEFRKKVVEEITDPVIKAFWINEFSRYSQNYEVEATAAIQNKVGQFISAPLIRNIIGQVASAIDMRKVMDEGKILIMNLSKGRIGEDNSTLLGALLITKLQLAAMSRVDILEKKRRDFYLYVDEFQNFATESFANILSEARKYRLALILAHQYIAQMEEEVRDAVFGNVGTLISFRVGAEDAEFLEKEFNPEFTALDLVNLTKYNVYLRLMIDGVAGRPFSAKTLLPFVNPEKSCKEKIINVSRERYGTHRSIVEEKIVKWLGLSELPATMPTSKAQQMLYSANCAVCGKPTKVVFPPDGVRPVYCKTCLKKTKQEESPRANLSQGGSPRANLVQGGPSMARPQSIPPGKENLARPSFQEATPSLSLEKATEEEAVPFGRPKRTPVDDSQRKKRKEVNLDELKSTLKEALNKINKPEEGQNN
jgi:CxxC-x17-CxxC domain-containing protein